jgi:hypothetical protein
MEVGEEEEKVGGGRGGEEKGKQRENKMFLCLKS